jgi:ribosomal protein S12 methylthiotransferase accessory factor
MLVGAELQAPAPIRSRALHGEELADVEARLERLLDLVPVTRVYDATPLDRLGVPVWAAVTPLAADLTVHAGKGMTPQAARVSALMEAIERVSAEAVAPERVLRSSFRELGPAAIDPELFDLPFDTTYRPDRMCAWVRGSDLLAERDVWVARDLVISPAREGVCSGPETNGLAAGSSALQAVLHGVLEVIERDAAAHERFLRRHGEGGQIGTLRVIAPDTLPDQAAELVQRLRSAGLEVTLVELTHDIGVPVFRAVLTDPSFPGREGQAARFEGLGCDLDAERALIAAVSEAAQSHTAVLVGARDFFEGQAPPASRSRFIEWLLAPTEVQPFKPSEGLPDGLADLLGIVVGQLRAAGFLHCVVVELTRPDLDVPVVRVLLPGAAGPWGETTRRPPERLLRRLL